VACAWALPERVTAVALVSSIIPLDAPGAVDELASRVSGGWRVTTRGCSASRFGRCSCWRA
jgi:hypothetical protein